jgi:hypothetical protein
MSDPPSGGRFKVGKDRERAPQLSDECSAGGVSRPNFGVNVAHPLPDWFERI